MKPVYYFGKPVYLLFICLRTNVFKNVGHAKLELVGNRGDPRVVLCFEYLLLTGQIQVS